MIFSQHDRIITEIQRCVNYAKDEFLAVDLPALQDDESMAEVAGCWEDVNFIYGHQTEITEQLRVMSKDPEQRKKKFPLFVLYTDISVNHNRYDGYDGVVLQMAVAHSTERKFTTPERKVKTFDPFLRPLLNYFFQALFQSSVFAIVDEDKDVRVNIIERYFWGKNGLYGNVGNVFEEYIDAIELQNLDLKIHKLC